jgi:hypothetical protein
MAITETVVVGVRIPKNSKVMERFKALSDKTHLAYWVLLDRWITQEERQPTLAQPFEIPFQVQEKEISPVLPEEKDIDKQANEDVLKAILEIGERVKGLDEHMKGVDERMRCIESERAPREEEKAITKTEEKKKVTPRPHSDNAENPRRSDIVERIKKMSSEGFSETKIADTFNKEGILTLSGRGEWQRGTIHKLKVDG